MRAYEILIFNDRMKNTSKSIKSMINRASLYLDIGKKNTYLKLFSGDAKTRHGLFNLFCVMLYISRA